MHSATTFVMAVLALPLTALAAPPRLPSSIFSRQENATENASCDLSTVQQPPNTMTPPASTLSLALIARGRGTQNYTCASPTSKPAAFGALASLFNASCTVASGGSSLGTVAEEGIGMHFFADATTPEFDIVGLGDTQAKKVESMAAPQATDVPWLRLEAQQQGTTSPVKQIYRLNTVGGVAPVDCEGQGVNSVVTVTYEAEYWVYASTEELAERSKKRRSLGTRVV
jgi:hypothetical protein